VTPRTVVGYDLARTITFSDAVIAIAMTLLALELPVPTGDTAAAAWDSFVSHLDDEYLSFLISFAVIAAFWFSHHRLFRFVARLDRTAALFNVICLFAIVTLPFASRVVAVDGQYTFGPVLYALVIVLYISSYLLMVRHVDRAGLLAPDAPPGLASDNFWGLGSVLAIFAASIPIAFVAPSTAEYSWLLIPVVSIVVDRVRQRRLRPSG